MPRWYDLAFRGVARGPVTRRIRTVNSSDWAVRARPPDGLSNVPIDLESHARDLADTTGNRSLQHVECPVQERAALLSRSYPSLRSHDLSRSDLEALASYTELFRVAAGTMIFHEATPGSWMSLVVSGEVEIRKLDAAQRDRVLATIGPGNLLGEMAFLDGQTRSATAIATLSLPDAQRQHI